MRTTQGNFATELAEGRGASKATARNLTIIVGVASAISTIATVIGLVLRLRGHG